MLSPIYPNPDNFAERMILDAVGLKNPKAVVKPRQSAAVEIEMATGRQQQPNHKRHWRQT
jgi:hypothetical protein